MSSSSKKTKKRSFSSRQTSSFSLSAETVGSNEDLLTEILVRLPIKSLLKFKCVSKHWLSLISNPRFSHRGRNSLSGLFLTGSNSPYSFYQFVSLDPNHSKPPFEHHNFANDPGDIEIIQSCNGLLLCRSFRQECSYRIFYVYNPTTKQYTILPRLRRLVGVGLAFDPSKSPYYKAICVLEHRFLQHHYQIEIYSSKTGSRRSSGRPFTTEDNILLRRGVFCNGVIHFLNASLCFDVDREQLKEMPLMPQIDHDHGLGRRRALYLEESGGRLHLIQIYGSDDQNDQANTQLDVYEMRADCSGWFKKYRIDLDAIAGAFPEMIGTQSGDFWGLNGYVFEVLTFVREETESDREDSFSVLLLHIPNKVIRYDFKDKSSTKLCDYYSLVEGVDDGPEDLCNFGVSVVFQYIESLACV